MPHRKNRTTILVLRLFQNLNIQTLSQFSTCSVPLFVWLGMCDASIRMLFKHHILLCCDKKEIKHDGWIYIYIYSLLVEFLGSFPSPLPIYLNYVPSKIEKINTNNNNIVWHDWTYGPKINRNKMCSS